METTTRLSDDPAVVQRILDHIDRRSTDLGEAPWREPVENYRSQARFDAEREVLRRSPAPFCPSAALPGPGSFVARDAAGTPILAVRGRDGRVRAFRNACRHRGAELAAGSGCQQAFVCRYHGWTYGLDGRLRHVPHEHGFPGLDKDARGLVPVETAEAQGLVFVTQAAPRRPVATPASLPPLVPPDYRLIDAGERDIAANWKIVVEGFLEGYHIKSTHPHSFYPVQYDNLNVVEHFGDNTRIVFPYRAVERQRPLAPEERSSDGKLTYVYHLFPNVMVATFPGQIIVVALEPQAIDRTRFVTWVLSNREPGDADGQAALASGADLIDRGAAEDREVACAIQRSLASGANEFFEFGLFEAGIGHFHRVLHAAVATEVPGASAGGAS
jgi:phenylpropionate dioxygenase-like ring-hydroxylating dioxygenase large terminal subunit